MARKQQVLAPDAEVVARLREVLATADEPLAASKLARGLKGPQRRSEQEVIALLDREAAEERVFRFAPSRGSSPRYGVRPRADYMRRVVEQAAAKKAKSLVELGKALTKAFKDLPESEPGEVLVQLLRERRMFRLPPQGSGRTPRYSTHPAEPVEYVAKPAAEFRKRIDKIARDLAECGVPAEATWRAVWEQCGLGHATRPLETGATGGATEEFDARFDAVFEALDRQKGRHNLVSLVDLRRALNGVTRAEFDRALHALRRAGRYGLSAAESVHGIQPEDRAAGILEGGSLLLHVSRK